MKVFYDDGGGGDIVVVTNTECVFWAFRCQDLEHRHKWLALRIDGYLITDDFGILVPVGYR